MCGIKILDVTYYRQSGAGDVEAAARKREEANAAFERECAEEAAKRACAPAPRLRVPAVSSLRLLRSASRAEMRALPEVYVAYLTGS